MSGLSTRDLASMLDLVRDLHDADPSALPGRCIAAMRDLIGSEVTTYSDFDLRTSIALEATDPSGVVTAAGQEAFERHLHEHPLITHYARTGDGSARKSSDFISQAQLHRMGLYNEYIKPFFGTRFQIAFAIAARQSRVIGMSLARAGRDFSERERLMLNMLRPHVAQAVRHAETSKMLPRLEESGDTVDPGRLCVVIDAAGRVRATTPTADAWLQRFFGPPRAGRKLPEPIWRWVTAQMRARDRLQAPRAAADTLVVEEGGARLILRCVIRERALFVMLELVEPHDAARRLERLGLTPREAEVLTWVAEGKDSRAVATITGSSLRTVEKHLERIYRKLNVENRTAAAAVVHSLPRS